MERQGQGAQAVSFILRRVEAGLEGNTYTTPGRGRTWTEGKWKLSVLFHLSIYVREALCFCTGRFIDVGTCL